MSLLSVSLIGSMPFSANFNSFRLVSGNGIGNVVVSAYNKVFAFMSKLGKPFLPLLAPRNALMAAQCRLLDFLIPLVLLASGKPEIRNSIVSRIPVNVVDNEFWPVPMIECPNHPASKIRLAQNTNCNHPISANSSGYGTGSHPSARGGAPKKASIRLINKLGLKDFLAYVRVFNPMHDASPYFGVIKRCIPRAVRVFKECAL